MSREAERAPLNSSNSTETGRKRISQLQLKQQYSDQFQINFRTTQVATFRLRHTCAGFWLQATRTRSSEVLKSIPSTLPSSQHIDEMTPRKSQARHKHQPSQPQAHPLQQTQASDYDSETPYNPTPLPTRTNTELNLSVLRRYIPSITDLPSLASSTDVYTYSVTAQAWERADINGSMFVCELNHGQGYSIIILNKKGLDNLIIDMVDMLEVEISTEFLIVRFLDKGEDRALGFFIQDVPEGTREMNSLLIKGCWEKVRQESGTRQDRVEILEDPVDEDKALPVAGQRLSLSDLFGRQDGMR